jgi:hypothetical protein
MRIQRLGPLFAFSALLFVVPIRAQQSTTPTRDPQALSMLQQCLTAAGGTQAISAIQDFTETGSITYFWAGQQVNGTVTIRGLGLSDFRLDANLPQGTRSWLVNGLQGTVKNADGSTKPISYADAVNQGGLTLPYLAIAAALNDPSVSISMAGTTTVNNRSGVIIQTQPTFASGDDPGGEVAKLNTKSYVIDSQTFVLFETQDTLWSTDGRMLPTKHEVIFSNFKMVNGISVPFSVAERVGGQETWSLQLTSVTFNSGLTTGLFQF